MRAHRLSALIALAAFIPSALGCSNTVIRTIENDPGDALTLGESVPIRAFTDQDGVRHVWEGTVEAAGADSLLFSRSSSGEYYWGYRPSEGDVELRLSRLDVASVEEKREDVLRSTFAIWCAAIGVMVLFGVILGATRTSDSGA